MNNKKYYKIRCGFGDFFMSNYKSDFQPIDEYDNPVKKIKRDYPYSYDTYLQFRNGENSEINGTIYSDRLSQWDYDKCQRLKLKHFGSKTDYWNEHTPEQIEAFLRDWTGKSELKLILIMEGCNVSNGYPYWRFGYKISNKDDNN